MTDLREELAPCPFCGGTRVKTTWVRDGIQAFCQDCGARGTPAFHGPATLPTAEERARIAWNTRADSYAITLARADARKQAIEEAAALADQHGDAPAWALAAAIRKLGEK